MKKNIAILLILAMLAAMLTACGDTGSTTPDSDNNSTSLSNEDTSDAAGDSQENDQEDDQEDAAVSAPVVEKEAFDNYARPVIVPEGIRVGYLIRQIEAESQARSLRQAEIECAQRGWNLIPIIYEVDTNFRDAFQNLLNQGVDAIIMGSTESTESKQDLIAQARNSGIGVYANDTQLVDGMISNCTMPNGTATMQLIYDIGSSHNWEMNIAFLTAEASQSCRERIEPAMTLTNGIYPSMVCVGTEDVNSTTLSVAEACFNFAQTWMQKYGTDLDMIYTAADGYGFCMTEAVVQAGDEHGENTFLVGFDGGSKAWNYIRNDTPFKYSYAQPFELYTHNVFEIIDDIQVEGLNPGEDGCLIDRPGDSLFFTGLTVTMSNCPEVGQSFHSLFDYYDESNTDAWYNWDDGEGAAIVTEI